MSSSTVEALSQDNQSRMAAILESCLFALEHGEALEPERLLAENPDLAEPLGKCLTTLMSLHAAVHGDETLPSSNLPEVGGRLGEFIIEELIGRGGMGTVYRATQPSLGRQVALKVLAASRLLAPTQLKRFQLEARAVAQLHHPHIVPVYSVGQEADVHYYAMQLIAGQSLEKIGNDIWDQPGFRKLIGCAIDLCDAIDHTHAVGIIHRDIKPSNLLLDNQDKIWITDFGLAQSRQDTRLTVSGDLVGTMNYMSPEQALGKPIDQRTDIYSLGVTLYEMLTGQQAFPGQVRAVVLRAIEESEPIAPRKLNAAIPYDLETVVLKAMSKDREQRYSTALEMQADLMRVRDGVPIHGKRPGWWQTSRRFARRYRLPVTVAAVGLASTSLAVVIGAASVLLTHKELVSARQQSQVHLKAAAENYWQGRNLVEHWNRDLVSQLADIPGAEQVRAQMLADTVEYYRAYIQDRQAGSTNDASLADDLVQARRGLAIALDQAGQSSEAIDAYRQVLADLKPSSSSDLDYTAMQLATVQNDMAVVMLRAGQIEQAQATLQAALSEIDIKTSSKQQATRAALLVNLARVHQAAGNLSAEAQTLDEAEQAYRRLSADKDRQVDGNWWHYQSELATVLDERALSIAGQDQAAALRLSREAVLLHQACNQSPRPANIWLIRLAASQHNQAVLLMQTGQLDQAQRVFEQAIASKQQLLERQGNRPALHLDLARSCNALGHMARRQADWQTASRAFDQAQKSLKAAIATGQNSENEVELAETLVNLWEAQNNLGVESPTHIQTELDRLFDRLSAIPLNSTAQENLAKLQQRCQQLNRDSARLAKRGTMTANPVNTEKASTRDAPVSAPSEANP